MTEPQYLSPPFFVFSFVQTVLMLAQMDDVLSRYISNLQNLLTLSSEHSRFPLKVATRFPQPAQ